MDARPAHVSRRRSRHRPELSVGRAARRRPRGASRRCAPRSIPSSRSPPIAHLSFVPATDYESTECLRRWCWCDALFMSPPAWVELSQQTGDPRYADFAMAEFWATTDFLYDPAEKLYFRDSRFFERRDEQGPQTVLEPRQRLGVRRHREHSRCAAERQSASPAPRDAVPRHGGEARSRCRSPTATGRLRC